MAYLLILLPVKMFCDVKLMDFFLGSANPDCFRLFSPFPRVRDIMAVFFYRLKTLYLSLSPIKRASCSILQKKE